MSDGAVSTAGPAEPLAAVWLAQGGRRSLAVVVLPVLAVATVAWVLTARAAPMAMTASTAFVLAWLVMMVAMMLPAVAPVVALYSLAARRRTVAAVPVFLAGYLVVWSVSALPAWAVSRAVSLPLMEGRTWVAQLTGGALVAAAAYQLTPLKTRCLQHCRSPLSFFLTRSRSLARPAAAFNAGARHGIYCLGCCWALMAVLVVLGGMQLGWALAIALAISAEKLGPAGPAITRLTAGAAGLLGLALLLTPSLLAHLIRM